MTPRHPIPPCVFCASSRLILLVPRVLRASVVKVLMPSQAPGAECPVPDSCPRAPALDPRCALCAEPLKTRKKRLKGAPTTPQKNRNRPKSFKQHALLVLWVNLAPWRRTTALAFAHMCAPASAPVRSSRASPCAARYLPGRSAAAAPRELRGESRGAKHTHSASKNRRLPPAAVCILTRCTMTRHQRI